MITTSNTSLDSTEFACDFCRRAKISVSCTCEYPANTARKKARSTGWLLQRGSNFAVCPKCAGKIRSGEIRLPDPAVLHYPQQPLETDMNNREDISSMIDYLCRCCKICGTTVGIGLDFRPYMIYRQPVIAAMLADLRAQLAELDASDAARQNTVSSLANRVAALEAKADPLELPSLTCCHCKKPITVDEDPICFHLGVEVRFAHPTCFMPPGQP